jgi:hypothetical protein
MHMLAAYHLAGPLHERLQNLLQRLRRHHRVAPADDVGASGSAKGLANLEIVL